MNGYKYYISVIRTSEEGVNDPMVYIDELDENSYLSRTVRVYKNAETKCATWEAGYKGEWFESTKLFSTQEEIDQMKNKKDFVFFEISKEDFEREWKKVTEEPGFKLRSYNEYIKEDYDR